MSDERLGTEWLCHATNVTGLGARQVVGSLLSGFRELGLLERARLCVAEGELAQRFGGAAGSCHLYRRRLPNGVSRAWELLRPPGYFRGCRSALVLGDVPLRGVENQTVLVHQPHLIRPEVCRESDGAPTYRLMRWLFAANLRYVKNCVVQTEVMRGNLIASYPALAGKVAVIPQPAPEWFRTVSRRKLVGDEVILFYPAANYAHKNHALIEAMNAAVPGELAGRVRFVVTYGQDRMVTGSIENMGRLDAAGCLEMYRTASALFFPSKAESYGLPLVEAMCAGLPVLCADLPYALWLCGGEAIYFNPDDPAAAFGAIRELRKRLKAGWIPNWSEALAKLPGSWREVAARMGAVMGIADE